MTDTDIREDYEAAAARFFERTLAPVEHDEWLLDNLDDVDWEDADEIAEVAEHLEASSLEMDMADLRELGDELRERMEEANMAYGVGITRHFRIELAGGGPAGWIEGELTDRNEAMNGRIAYVDWFKTPLYHVLDDSDLDSLLRVMGLDGEMLGQMGAD